MKTKLIGPIFTSVIALAVGAWAFYEFQQSQKDQEQKEKASSLLSLELEELKSFRIVKEDSQLKILKKEEQWFLEEPVQDRASFSEISRWFDEIKNQKVQKIQIKEDIDWKSYHLDSSPMVEIQSSSKKISFSVSKKSSFDGKYFIKKGKELFIGESYLHSEVNQKDFESFRSKKLLPAFLGHAQKIEFQGKWKGTLHWKNHKWSMENLKGLPLDSVRLDGFWTDLSSMQAKAIHEVLSPSTLKKYNLNNQTKITFHYPQKKIHLQISPIKEGSAFVTVSHRNFILELSEESAKKLILSDQEIRDHGFPFDYETRSIAQIERKSNKTSFSIKKEKGEWQSLNKKEKVDPKQVKQLLDKIQNLRGKKYKKAEPSAKSLRAIQIKNAKAELIFELKEIATNKLNTWLKTNLWAEEIAVPKKDLEDILNKKIFLTDKTKTEEKKDLKTQ